MNDYLIEKYRVDLSADLPILVPGFLRRWHLPLLFKDLGYKTGAEIGVAGGRQSLRFCRMIPDIKFVCVDAWEKYEYDRQGRSCRHQMNHVSNYEMAQRRLAPYDVTFMKMDSSTAADKIPNESLDFVYIDANHYYEYVKKDLEEWSKKVRAGGIISGHDYFVSPNCDVIQATNEFTQQNNISPWFITDESSASYFWMKK